MTNQEADPNPVGGDPEFGPAQPEEPGVPMHLSEYLPSITRDQLRQAVNQHCTCGGRPATNSAACPACMVWHELVRL